MLLTSSKRALEKIIKENDNHETNSQKKIRNYAEEGLLSIEQLERDLEDSEQSDATNKYAIEDIKFIESLSEPRKNKKKERNIRQRQSKRSF